MKPLSGWYADYLSEYGAFDPDFETPEDHYRRTGRKRPMENDYGPAPKGEEFVVSINIGKAWNFFKWVAECVRSRRIILKQKGKKASST